MSMVVSLVLPHESAKVISAMGFVSLSWAAALLYLSYGTLILRALRTPQAKADARLRYGAILAFLLHLVAVFCSMFSGGEVRFSFGLAVSVLFLAASFVVIAESFVHRVTVLMGFVLILCAPASLLPEFFVELTLAGTTLAFRAHLAFGLLAYGFVAIAAVQAVLLSLMGRQLKHPDAGMNGGWLSNMPNLMAMERILFRIVACAFVSLTLVLVFGAWATYDVKGVFFGFDHKTILTWVSWLVFAVLLIGRVRFGWREKVALCWFWLGSGLLVVAYLLYRFLIDVVFHGVQ